MSEAELKVSQAQASSLSNECAAGLEEWHADKKDEERLSLSPE